MSSSEKMIFLFFWNFRHFRIFSRDDWKGYFFLLFNGICNFILDAIDKYINLFEKTCLVGAEPDPPVLIGKRDWCFFLTCDGNPSRVCS